MASRRRPFTLRVGRSVRVLLAPAHRSTPLSERLQLRLMGDLLTALLPLFAVMAVLSMLTRRAPLTALSFLDGVVLMGGTVVAWRVASGGARRTGAALLAATDLAGAFLGALNEPDPVRALATASFSILAVLYASFLLSPRETVFAGVASLATVVVLPLFHPAIHVRQLVLPTFFQLFVSSLVAITAYQRHRHLAQLERSNDALAEGARRLRVTMDSSLDAMVALDAKGRITEWSRQAELTFGLSRDEAILRELTSLCFAPAEAPRIEALLAAVMASPGTTRRLEVDARVADGRALPVELSAAGLRLRGRNAAAVFMRDLSERRELQAELMQQDRLVSVGRLAAGVAHEINNPMLYVLTNLEAVREVVDRHRDELADDAAELDQVLDDALDGARLVQHIARDLKVFSRVAPDLGQPVAVESVLDGAAHLARHEIRHRAQLVRRYAPAPLVLGQEARLGQVFLNLVVNAVQAFESKSPANEIELAIETLDDGRVLARVADNGRGMTPEVQQRLFTPFFSTKPAGEGTGLGLYLSRNIVRSLGGELRFSSEQGRGSRFEVLLPAAPADVIVARAPGPAVSDLRACRTEPPLDILVVDDDAAVLRAMERTLAHHRVFPCASGDEALRLCRERAFDLVLCDVMMPGMTGPELSSQLVRDRLVPPERIVFVTGGGASAALLEASERRMERWLEKPLQLERVNEVLVDAARRRG